jgi:NAD(P)-dependent dehydrogenase (short-subunit alcohol dehydrogenase family)
VSDPDVALVTGASKGIGKAVARQLAGLGMTVYAGARDPARGERAATEVGARFVRLDVTDQESIAAAARLVEEQAGRLDVLVNNAGINPSPAPPSQTSIEVLRRTYETNVFGVVAVTNALLPLLRRSRAARIVNLSSELGSLHHQVAADHPAGDFPNLLAYSTSKTALNAVTVAYANELRAEGIRVNAVSPGLVATDLNGHQGPLTPEQGARIPVLMASSDDGPTGTFRGEDWTDGRPIPW